jgi:hypothetical protein
MYQIQPYTLQQAKLLNVIIRPSVKKGKKLDIFDATDGNYITSVGALGMGDFPTYLNTKGKAYAENRRRLFKLRTEKSRHIIGSNMWFADKLLW